MIDLQPSSEQEQIVRSVTDFLANELPLERLRSPLDARPNEDGSKWTALGSLGLFGLGLAESLGGVGYGLAEEVLVFREFGRFLVSPAALSSVLGARVAAHSGRPDLISSIASGEMRLGLAVPFEYGAQQPPLDGEYYLIDGSGLDWWLTWNDAGAALIPGAAFTAIEEVASIDWTVSLARARLAHCAPDLWVRSDVDEIAQRASLLAAAMLTGVAESAVADSVEYVKARHQFGQPLGAFQSVKHRCADMATRAGAAWCQTLFAALMLQQGSADSAFQIAAAKIVATDVALRNAAADIQNLGGMGFTSEQNPHLFLKRAHLLDRIGGDLTWHQERLMAMPSPLGQLEHPA